MRRFFAQFRRRKRAEPLLLSLPPARSAETPDTRDAWWSKLTAREPSEVRFLLELSERLPAGEIRGVGYAPDPAEKEWRPLLLLDARNIGLPPGRVLFPAAELERLSSQRVNRVLSDLPGAVILPVAPLEPLAGTNAGQSIRERQSRETATLGVRALRSVGGNHWRRGFLTAGHAFPGGPGAEVFSVPNIPLGRYLAAAFNLGRRFGTVALQEAPSPPSTQQRYDYAFVDLEFDDGSEWDPQRFVSQLPTATDLESPRLVVLKGGASRATLQGSLMGALMGMECWRDCWMFGPTGIIESGDSGSAVMVAEEGENLGVLVGRSSAADQEHHVYVQSLQRLQDERLRSEGILVEQFAKGGRE